MFTFTLNFELYNSYQGEGQNSGAYIFRPAEQMSHNYFDVHSTEVYLGEIVQQITIHGSSGVIRLRIFNLEGFDNHFEVESDLNAIDIEDGQGKEIILAIQTKDFDNKGIFYTDENGLELQMREVDKRPTWDFSSE